MLKLAQATNEVLVPGSALWGHASAGPLARSAARPCKHPSGGAKERNLVETVHTLGSSFHAVQHIPVVRHFLAQTNSRDVAVVLQNNDGVQVRLRGDKTEVSVCTVDDGGIQLHYELGDRLLNVAEPHRRPRARPVRNVLG